MAQEINSTFDATNPNELPAPLSDPFREAATAFGQIHDLLKTARSDPQRLGAVAEPLQIAINQFGIWPICIRNARDAGIDKSRLGGTEKQLLDVIFRSVTLILLDEMQRGSILYIRDVGEPSRKLIDIGVPS